MMKKSVLFAAFGAACLFFDPSSAFAQEGAEGEVTEFNFDDELVTGDLVRPDGELLQVRRRGRRSSLIRIREHFIPEMLKSVEDL